MPTSETGGLDLDEDAFVALYGEVYHSVVYDDDTDEPDRWHEVVQSTVREVMASRWWRERHDALVERARTAEAEVERLRAEPIRASKVQLVEDLAAARAERDAAHRTLDEIETELRTWPKDATQPAYNEAMDDARRVVANALAASRSSSPGTEAVTDKGKSETGCRYCGHWKHDGVLCLTANPNRPGDCDCVGEAVTEPCGDKYHLWPGDRSARCTMARGHVGGCGERSEAVTEPETIRWADTSMPGVLQGRAEQAVQRINEAGGEAEFDSAFGTSTGHGPRIAVRTSTGWDYMQPGDEAVKGGWFETEQRLVCGCNAITRLREFTVRRPSPEEPDRG
jgi:hypothetical protein